MTDTFRKAALLPFLLAAASAEIRAEPAPQRTEAPRIATSREDLEPLENGPTSEHELGVVGSYTLVRHLGSGGMGSVFLAESFEPVPHRVALKLVHAGTFSPVVFEQFDVERRALARAEHDHVARYLGAGATDDGRPWLAMEYVEGEPIDAYCDRLRLDLDARLELFRDVCAAVGHLHERGVVHGDLKPANILVTERDGHAHAKVIDLGLARLDVGPNSHDDLVMGTPKYMAPELFAFEASQRDRRSDVYALGVVLRDLLAGVSAVEENVEFGDVMLSKLGATSSLTAALDSSRANALKLARQRATSVARLRRRLSGTLDLIAKKSVARDREVRIASPNELATALENEMRSHARKQRLVRAGWSFGAVATASFALGSWIASA